MPGASVDARQKDSQHLHTIRYHVSSKQDPLLQNLREPRSPHRTGIHLGPYPQIVPRRRDRRDGRVQRCPSFLKLIQAAAHATNRPSAEAGRVCVPWSGTRSSVPRPKARRFAAFPEDLTLVMPPGEGNLAHAGTGAVVGSQRLVVLASQPCESDAPEKALLGRLCLVRDGSNW